jgi:hypothetical protein
MAASPVRSIGTIMETLFGGAYRYKNRGGRLPRSWTEVELLPGLTIENVWAAGIMWDGFHRFLHNKVVWMTPDVYVCSVNLSNTSDPLVLTLGEYPGNISLSVHATPDTAASVATATCDFLLRLVATCEESYLFIDGSRRDVSTPLSGAAISLFFQESRGVLRKVKLARMALNEYQCRALATMSRLDVELVIYLCLLADDAADSFIECLQSDRGPVELDLCAIDCQILTKALTGNSRVTRYMPYCNGGVDADMAILFRALADNRGLVGLNFRYGGPISDENWTILSQSLQAHPSLTSLNLCDTIFGSIALSTEQRAQRTRALAEMMKLNTVLNTIELAELSEGRYGQHIYTQEIHPYLVTNQYRPRFLAVNKTEDGPFREKVLGRALYSVRSNPNLVWMLLSENVDAFVRSEEEEESNSEVLPVAVGGGSGSSWYP